MQSMSELPKKAFTLIELLVVIAIIGILSGLIVVGMSSMTNNANLAKAQVFSNSLRNSLMGNIAAEWKFDGPTADGGTATANDVLDTWSKINNGTIGGAPVVKTGSSCVNGDCLQFDGVDDYVDFGNDSSLSMGAGDATVSFWVKFDNAVASATETLIFCGGDNDAIGHAGYLIKRDLGTSRLYGNFNNSTVTRASGNLSAAGSLISGTWYNIVIVFTRSSNMQAYINGMQQVGYSVNISGKTGSITNSQSYRIGTWGTSGLYLFPGKMDEIRVYNAAMPISQIKDYYYAGLNNLFANGGLTNEEYLARMGEVATTLDN